LHKLLKLLSISGLFMVGACQASSPAGPGPTQATGLQSPSPLAELQAATILDVEAYRPSVRLAGCGTRKLPTALPDADLAQAIEAAQEYSDQYGGISFAVLHDGVLLHEAYAPNVNAKTPTVSASMAKSVLGLVTGIAIEEDLISSIEDKVGQYIAEWESDPRGEMQVKHLLTMSSGLGRYDGLAYLAAQDSTPIILETQLAHPPGTEFAYSNAVSQTLAIVIDRQARAKGYDGYADFLQQKLWCPLGNGDALLWVDPVGMPRAYAGLHTGLHDWARLGELIRNKGRAHGRQVVSEGWIEQMTAPSPSNPQYGFQIWLGHEWTAKRRYSSTAKATVPHSEPFVASDIAYFDGFGGQRVYVLPSQGLTIVRTGLTNMEYDDAIIPNLLARAVD
jgi:CubicO group peptidase (beta-lactamase class C family)